MKLSGGGTWWQREDTVTQTGSVLEMGLDWFGLLYAQYICSTVIIQIKFYLDNFLAQSAAIAKQIKRLTLQEIHHQETQETHTF